MVSVDCTTSSNNDQKGKEKQSVIQNLSDMKEVSLCLNWLGICTESLSLLLFASCNEFEGKRTSTEQRLIFRKGKTELNLKFITSKNKQGRKMRANFYSFFIRKDKNIRFYN